jgi:hypothetical protein
MSVFLAFAPVGVIRGQHFSTLSIREILQFFKIAFMVKC